MLCFADRKKFEKGGGVVFVAADAVSSRTRQNKEVELTVYERYGRLDYLYRNGYIRYFEKSGRSGLPTYVKIN